MNILLAVDGSDCSLAAAEVIANRPWPTGSVVKILSVVRLPFTPTAETRALPDSEYSQLENAAMQQAKAAIDAASVRFNQAESAAGENPIAIITDVLIGQQQEVILEQAEQWGADLVVLGSRGLSGFKRFMLGSVSSAVATHANCSVEIVRIDETHPVRKTGLKILLAVDGSTGSDAAVVEVAGCPWPMSSTVKIISAVEPYLSFPPQAGPLPEIQPQEWQKAYEAEARACLERATAQFHQIAGSTTTVLSAVIPGRARDVILDEAQSWGADLVVLGSRGLGGVKRLLLGSVSSAVLSQVSCSVRIVRQRSAV